MISSDFLTRWKWITKRAGGELNVVQERNELNHIYDLMEACKCGSYLEVGSAEGGSLYVLGPLVSGEIDIIDFGEEHTKKLREEVIHELGKPVRQILGDSRHKDTHDQIKDKKYDCVLIDGGHDYETVSSDCHLYVPLATKYVFFHDVQLPQVRKAIDDYLGGKYLNTFINSNSYGYGILKC